MPTGRSLATKPVLVPAESVYELDHGTGVVQPVDDGAADAVAVADGLEGASAVNETVGLLVLSYVHPDSDAFVVQAKKLGRRQPGTDSIVQVGPCLRN